MAVKVAINGFGRIGRLAFRQMFGAEGYEVVAINDLTSPKMLAHLLKYDSSQGTYEKAATVKAGEDSITVDGQEIKIYAFPDANNCPWGEIGVDVVLECSGFYTSKEKAQAHINAGAKKVVISAPAGNDLPTVVYNTNHTVLKPEDKIISAASCTTNCLAPMADALNKYAAIQSGIMCTIHALSLIHIFILNAFATFRSQENVETFGRRIEWSVIKNASTIAMMYCMLFLCGGITISVYEGLPLSECLYEAASAVGTVGLTLGITPKLHIVSQFILIILMYLGRVGGLTLIYAVLSKKKKGNARLPLEKLTVG